MPSFVAADRPAPAGRLALLPASHVRRAPARAPVAILGVPLDPLTVDETLARIAAMVDTGRPHYVVTPNVDFLVQARSDAALRRILGEADLVLCDGQPLVWASRWLGNPLPERVAGADLAPRLLAQAERLGHRVFLLGAAPEANAAAVARLRLRHPRLVIAGSFAPPFRPLAEMDHADIIRRVRAAQPHLLLVGFGCPKQEKWMAMHYRELGVPVCLGLGATIDFLAGRVRRAPGWMHRAGLEWTYRLWQEPRRLFRRYATDLRLFGFALFAQWWALGRRMGRAGGSVRVIPSAGGVLRLRAAGALDRAAVEAATEAWRRIRAGWGDCELDLADVEVIDSTGAAALIVWRRELRRRGRRLTIVRARGRVGRQLATFGPADLATGVLAPLAA
ncbi:MAG TPA: WecB/TagA/CpsF family glycosyltransferase [Lacunisphaera sp.]|jgi:exopolysaccharide biosynthesis WecB/TagA/CpsF family protein/anti-anti-sigma factor|nr:WecB/TagA/CpsF family glycosyltransferase [Lacunisphaera sp.]